MKQIIFFFICFSYSFIPSPVFSSNPLIHHELKVILDFEKSNASISDTVTIPHNIIQSSPSFSLSKNAKIKQATLNGEGISPVVSENGFLKFNLQKHIEASLRQVHLN